VQAPLDVGPRYLKLLFLRFLQRVGPERVASIDAALSAAFPDALVLGTCCSGTDSPLLALRDLVTVLRAECGSTFSLNHEFSSEICRKKQLFLRRCFPELQTLFADTKDCRMG
jgi:hypothetical protein